MARPRKPPTRAPAMPSRMVTMMPPGSSPGMRSFATAPMIRPRTIITRKPVMVPPMALSLPSGVAPNNRMIAWGAAGSNSPCECGSHAGASGSPRQNRSRRAISGDDAARQHIAQREHDQDGEPREAAHRGDLGQPAREANVHEVEDHERRLEEGDQQHHDHVERPEVHVRDRGRDPRQDEERDEDDQVDAK